MKTEVYSWRVSSELKTRLEREARRRNAPVSALLDRAVEDLLAASGSDAEDDEEQQRLRRAFVKCVGAFAGTDPDRSTKVRQIVQQRLRKKYEA